MPQFLLPVVVLSLVSLTGFGYVVLNLSPDETASVALFLVTLFLSLVPSLSLLLFFLHKKFFFKPKAFTAFGPLITEEEMLLLFRTSLRRAVLVAVVVIVSAILKVFEKLNGPTAGVVAVFTVLLELYLWRKH